MITLIINNSMSQLTDLSVAEFRQVKNLLSYIPDTRPGSIPFKKYLIDKKGVFPTGLKNKVIYLMKQQGWVFHVNDRRTPPQPASNRFTLNLGGLVPYPEQIKASSLPRGRGTVVMPTGLGKSLTMALLVNRMQVRTLIIVPNLELKRQLTDSFKQLFGEVSNRDLRIENVDSPNLKKEMPYDLLIVDEAHHAASKTYRTLNAKYWNSIYFRYFFTATPYRTQDEEQILLEGITGQVVYEVEYQTAVSKGYIVPVESYYLQVPKVKIQANTWAQFYSEGVVWNDVRNQSIAELLRKLHSSGISTLCLVKEIAHGEILSQLTGAAFASGVNEETPWLIEKFSKRELKTLIATTGIVGEGVDTKACEFVIIAGLGKARGAFLQQCGRGVRKFGNKQSCSVILIKDLSHKWAKRHYVEQVKILQEEYNSDPVEIKL